CSYSHGFTSFLGLSVITVLPAASATRPGRKPGLDVRSYPRFNLLSGPSMVMLDSVDRLWRAIMLPSHQTYCGSLTGACIRFALRGQPGYNVACSRHCNPLSPA